MRGSNALTLITGSAGILFEDMDEGTAGIQLPTLTAATISLTQNGAFGLSAPAILAADGLVLTNTGTNTQAVQSWMASGNRALSLISGGTITVGINLDTGTGALALEAQGSGNISFTGGARTLGGGDITLTSANDITAADGALTITATGTATGILTLAADFSSTNALTLSADTIAFTGGIRQIGGSAITLTSANTITADDGHLEIHRIRRFDNRTQH